MNDGCDEGLGSANCVGDMDGPPDLPILANVLVGDAEKVADCPDGGGVSGSGSSGSEKKEEVDAPGATGMYKM